MELSKEYLNSLKEKVVFTKKLGNVIEQFNVLIQDLDYEVFLEEGQYVTEYLVVTYKGGAIATRNCNGDSLSAIFDEVSRLFKGGYYDEVEIYNQVKETSQKIF